MRCPHCGANHRPIINPQNPRSSSPGKALFMAGIGFVVFLMAAAIQGNADEPVWWSVLPPLLITVGCIYYSLHLAKNPTVRSCGSCGRDIDVKPWSL